MIYYNQQERDDLHDYGYLRADEEVDPALASLADMQPVVEPMSLEAWEERDAAEYFAEEDERAEAAAKLAWSMKVRKAA